MTSLRISSRILNL